MDLEVKGRAKSNLASWHRFRLGSRVCLSESGKRLIPFSSRCLWEALSASLAGRLALCLCADVLLANAWPCLLLPPSLHFTLKPS